MSATPLQIIARPSPNCGPRRDGLTPALVVLHYTAMDSADAALDRLCDPHAEVSAHYLISGSGIVTQMVAEADRAWHAGEGSWQGQDDINSRSIGIELDNRGTHPFSEPQMVRLEELLCGIMARWDIPANGVIGHSDMAPGRKIDPGPHFDWARLARQGLAAPPSLSATQIVDEHSFRTCAQTAGYPQDTPFASLLAATRLRVAPWRKGVLTLADYTLPSP